MLRECGPGRAPISCTPQDAWGLPAFRISSGACAGQQWARHLANGDVAALLLNRAESAVATRLDFSSFLNGSTAGVYAVRDLQARRDLGPQCKYVSVTLAPHQTAFLRLVKLNDSCTAPLPPPCTPPPPPFTGVALAVEPTTIEIAPGVRMPYVSDGVIFDTNATTNATKREVDGLELFFSLGGRGIDTAWSYFNQPAVGAAVREQQSVPRQEVFVTTKIECMGTADAAYGAIHRDLVLLGLDYVDLSSSSTRRTKASASRTPTAPRGLRAPGREKTPGAAWSAP